MTYKALLASVLAMGTAAGVSAQSAPLAPDQVFVSCSSGVGSAYSGTGRRIDWSVFVAVADLQKAGFATDRSIDTKVESRFVDWVKATGQYGRWNSVWESNISCSTTDAGYPQRRAGRDPSIADWRAANLPADWYKRDPKDPAEIARYSTGKAVPGSDAASTGTLTVAPATPPVEPGWDAKVREGQRKDAADRIRAAAGTEKMRQESQVALAKLLAEMKKRGSAQ